LKIPFKEFKITVRGVILIWQKWDGFCGLANLWMGMTSETRPVGDLGELLPLEM